MKTTSVRSDFKRIIPHQRCSNDLMLCARVTGDNKYEFSASVTNRSARQTGKYSGAGVTSIYTAQF